MSYPQTGSMGNDSRGLAIYCYWQDIYDRLLIMDHSYDTQMSMAAGEASRLVDMLLTPYVSTLPLPSWDSNIEFITADFCASIFKRRLTPNEVTLRGTLQPDMINDVDGTGWFAMFLTKIERYIKSYFVLTQAFATTGNAVNNPSLFLTLFKQGIITGVEARKYMNQASQVVLNQLETLVKTVTETRTITESTYKTKQQKAFAFVSAQNPTNGLADGYKEDSETD